MRFRLRGGSSSSEDGRTCCGSLVGVSFDRNRRQTLQDCLRVRFWPVTVLCSGIVREFARSANSSRVLALSALACCATGPTRVSCEEGWGLLGVYDKEPLAMSEKPNQKIVSTHLTVHDGLLCALHRGVVLYCGHCVLCSCGVLEKGNGWCAGCR
jgi:hypothetical protein